MSNDKTRKAAKRKRNKLADDVYDAELFRLQTEFVKLQEWTKHSGARIVVQ